MNQPCPMCGEMKEDYQDQIKRKEWECEMMKAFVAGRRSWQKFSRRENEVFDAFYDLGIKDFKHIAQNFGIKRSSVETYYDRAMEKMVYILENYHG